MRTPAQFDSIARILRSSGLCALALWLAVGPLALMQIGAWAWMLGSYSQESSFEQAVIETFGDLRPCDVCVLIDDIENDGSETSEQTTRKELKLMLGLAQAINCTTQANSLQRVHRIDERPNARHTGAPSPPPRVA
ncbi:MAG: hypothetical protein AAGC73_02035 [Verrucomicrobiota bacterium]